MRSVCGQLYHYRGKGTNTDVDIGNDVICHTGVVLAELYVTSACSLMAFRLHLDTNRLCAYHLFVRNNVGTIEYIGINKNKNKLSD